MFGNWTTTPYCNATCGSHRFYLKMRSCTLVRPNLPSSYSCLDESLTLQTSTVACEPTGHCTGNMVCFYFQKLSSKGDWRDWSSWSGCSANCSLGLYQGEKTRQRRLRGNPSVEPDVQTQPCSIHCPPGHSFYLSCRQFSL